MKHLNEFVKFDFDSWCLGKDFKVTNINPWIDRSSGTVIGSSVEVVILKDECPNYKLKDGESFSMVYDKVVFKVTACNAQVGDYVTLVNSSPVVYVNNGFMNVSFKGEAVSKIKGKGD